jgi:heme-degrading monooxygenase HmoA
MYGTASTFRVPAGKEQAFRDVYLKEGAAYCAGLDGFVAEYLLQPDDFSGEWVSLTIFDSEESYRKTTTAQEIDRVYRKLVGISGEEPSWHDGTISLAEARTVVL